MADGGLIDFTGKDLPAGATIGSLTDFTGKDLPKGARVGLPTADPYAPNAVQRAATKISDAATSAEGASNLTKAVGGLGLVRALVSPFEQRKDPTGKSPVPLSMPEGAIQDVAGGLAQWGGAAGGGAAGGAVGSLAGGPVGGLWGAGVGASVGAGLGATAADIALAKYNQQVHGWGFKPTIKGAVGTFALGAATEGIPTGTAAAERALLGRKLTKAGAEAGEEGVEKLYTEELPKAKPGFEEAVTKAEAQKQAAVEAAKANARGEVSQKVVPRAAQMELENFVGRTPEQMQAMRNAPQDFFANRRTRMAKAAVWDPMNRFAGEMGKEYEIAAPQEFLVKPAGEMTATNDAVKNEFDTIKKEGLGEVSPKVTKLAQALQHTGDSDWGLVAGRDGADAASQMLSKDPAALEQRAGEIRKEAQSSHEAYVNSATRELKSAKNARSVAQTPELAARLDEDIKDAEAKLAKAQAAPIKPFGSVEVPALTNSDILRFRRLASSFVGTTDGPSSVAASTIRDALDNKLKQNGIQIPASLDMRWATYKNVFDPQFRRQVAKAVHPEEYAKAIFTEPQRFNPLWKEATPQERVAMRSLFKNWALSIGPEGLRNVAGLGANKLDPKVLRTIFGDTPYSRLAPWLDSDAEAMGWEKALAAAPAPLKQQMMVDARDEMQKGIQDAAMKGATSITKAGKDLARKLGPAGSGILNQLNGMNPVEGARYVQQKLMSMMKDVPEPMPGVGTPAMESYRTSKAITKGIDINAKREAAAVARIRQMAHQGDTFVKNLQRKAYFYGPLLVALSATGHPSPYLLAAGAYSLLGSLIYSPRGAMLKALDSDLASTMFYRGIKMAPNTLNAKAYAKTMGQAAADLVAKSLTQQAASSLGLSAGQPPEEKEGEGE